MGRRSHVLIVVVILAVAAPAPGAPSRRTVGCGGPLSSGGTASCTTTATIPHFDRNDGIDYSTLVARVVSAQATSWRVTGWIYDGRGKRYFVWTCSGTRSTVTMGSESHFEKSCWASRRTVRVKRGGRWQVRYYTADTSRPQTVTVRAEVEMCAPSCRFEATAEYVFAR